MPFNVKKNRNFLVLNTMRIRCKLYIYRNEFLDIFTLDISTINIRYFKF